MRKKRQLKRKAFSILATFLMILSLVAPTIAIAQSSQKNESGKQSLSVRDSEPVKEKVTKRLLDVFNKDETTTFLVKFKDKADTTEAAEQAKQSAQKNSLSAEKIKFIQRSAVLSELKSVALASQENVIEFLKKAKADGMVEDFHAYHIVNGIAVTATKEVAEQIATFSEVEKILPNEERRLMETTITNEKAPESKLADVEWNVERVNAPQVWGMGFDGTGTVVGSLDSGVQWDHPALKEKYRGYDNETGEVDHTYSFHDGFQEQDAPYDDHGHGTHVTGTMVGSEPDGTNQVGVAPGAKWIAAKVFDAAGSTTDAILLDAAEWMLAPGDRVDMAPDVVNNSWGGGPGLDEWYLDAVRAWRDAEIFPEFSAGNVDLFNPGGPGSVAVPANYPESFATGATDSDDMIAGFSLRGPSPYDEVKPDISAPGVNIRSSVPGGDYEGGWNGTSMAGPAVSAVAALLRQVNANITVDEMEEILMSTAIPRTDDEYPESPNNGYGSGLINAYDAVAALQDGLGTIEGYVTQADDNGSNTSAKVGSGDALMADGTPISATVSVLESGRSVSTDPEDGSYSLMHAVGEFTVLAEAYGYESEEQTVTVEADEGSTVNFAMQELPNGHITGTVTDEQTGNPVEGATVLLVEDANVQPVQTDENGNYTLKAYHGIYTLKINARGYHGKEVEVEVAGDVTVDLELEPFYMVPGEEIGYDDGTAENARVYYDAGNGWAVKMSLPDGKDSAIVTDGVFRFWDTEFPVPGGEDFQIEVWDATGNDGLPGEKLAGPIDATALRTGEWTVVDLTEHNIQVDGDFYMVYIQTDPNPNAPALATDEDGPNAERSYQYVDGAWSAAPVIEGNYMIRARVGYGVETPVITSPEDGFVTNESTITVEGTASPTTTVELLNNESVVGTAEIDEDGVFSIDAALEQGENTLVARSTMNDAVTGESEAITVVMDQEGPELTIDNPKDGSKTNKETTTVEGTVVDDYLDYVEVNGQKTNVDDDGSFSKRILLDNGENVIEVSAYDEAGNVTTKTVTVEAKYEVPIIENLTPASDVDLQAGESVMIEFDSEPGLRATFVIHMPLTNHFGVQLTNATELPMMEVSPGHYVGYYTATNNVVAEGAVIEVITKDSFGNEAREKATGQLNINIE